MKTLELVSFVETYLKEKEQEYQVVPNELTKIQFYHKNHGQSISFDQPKHIISFGLHFFQDDFATGLEGELQLRGTTLKKTSDIVGDDGFINSARFEKDTEKKSYSGSIVINGHRGQGDNLMPWFPFAYNIKRSIMSGEEYHSNMQRITYEMNEQNQWNVSNLRVAPEYAFNVENTQQATREFLDKQIPSTDYVVNKLKEFKVLKKLQH